MPKKPKVRMTCPTRKQIFRDEITAKLAASKMNTPRRSYDCNLCPGWHHSTQTKRHSA